MKLAKAKPKRIEIVINIPFPLVKFPSWLTTFPPKVPSFKLLKLPKALDGIAEALDYLQAHVELLVGLIPDIEIHIVVRVGQVKIIDETISPVSIVL